MTRDDAFKKAFQDICNKKQLSQLQTEDLCKHFFELGVKYAYNDSVQIPALFKPKGETK